MKFTQQQIDALNAKVAKGRGAPQKASLSQLIESYNTTKSVWATASQFGMCGQSVHERLSRAGVVEPVKNEFSADQCMEIKLAYESGFTKGDGTLGKMASRFGKSVANICRWARRNGLTNTKRTYSNALASAMGNRVREQWKNGKHPRGMLGKKHSQETKSRLSEAGLGRVVSDDTRLKIARTHVARYGSVAPKVKRGSWKAEWVEVGGQRFFSRSRWESNYAHYLEFLTQLGELKSWEHEPETFWFEGIKRGCCSYLPDFKVTLANGIVQYHEVKGWMDERSKTKIRRMAKYFPKVKLIVRDAVWYRANQANLSRIVKGWK